ncbi:DUF4335 domain-containing protein [Leptolyngbya sp. FACHB-541]|uniref:DUF4335 domain-containing protein n=1 Tax=Leptolyngbya sp. FACHB-541 TaxID=2692810 RepID=UPI0016820E98|nr:DUF4335 domain-containing protein [Leptolyngbya sp. FACHB-541]MBD1999419.1 DUF4335 domain-containing protein [Leptolyngbya sp. FACHB-541]
MSLPNSVLRRYTPPTCTLEIAAKGSPLSRWAGRPVLKQLRFQLSFDDPRLPPEEQVQITGDRAQLEALCEAVERYVQNVLGTAPTPGQSPPLLASFDQLESLPGAASSRVGNGTAVMQPEEGNGTGATGSATEIYLKPKGLLSHDLCLGELSTGESNVVRLSALQLFDLANALDEYSAEAIALPTLNRPTWLNATPAWAKVAAVLVLAVGVTASIVRFVDPYAGQSTITAANEDTNEIQTAEGTFSEDPQDIALTPLPSGKDTTPPNSQPLDIPLPPPNANTLPSPGTGLPSVGVPRTPTPNAPVPNTSSAPSAPTNLPDVAIAPSQQRSDAPGTGSNPSELQVPTESEAADAPSSAARSSSGQGDAFASSEAAPSDEGGGDRPNPGSTAFDTIPQVAEARAFFQERWQPPESLDQTLEYRLQLGADGTIQRIIPLGRAAGDYIDRTGMPLPGEPFVSPVENGGNPQIRIVLDPSGRVQTFMESP